MVASDLQMTRDCVDGFVQPLSGLCGDGLAVGMLVLLSVLGVAAWSAATATALRWWYVGDEVILETEALDRPCW